MIMITILTFTIPPIESTNELTNSLILGFLEMNLRGIKTLNNLKIINFYL